MLVSPAVSVLGKEQLGESDNIIEEGKKLPQGVFKEEEKEDEEGIVVGEEGDETEHKSPSTGLSTDMPSSAVVSGKPEDGEERGEVIQEEKEAEALQRGSTITFVGLSQGTTEAS